MLVWQNLVEDVIREKIDYLLMVTKHFYYSLKSFSYAIYRASKYFDLKEQVNLLLLSNLKFMNQYFNFIVSIFLL